MVPAHAIMMYGHMEEMRYGFTHSYPQHYKQCCQLHVAAALPWYRPRRRWGVHHSRPGRTGENTVTPPCRKAEHESTVAQFVGCGPPKSCASVCSSNIQHEALTGVTTKVVFFWDLALMMEAAVLSETLVLSYETIWLYIPEDSIRRRAGRMNSSPKNCTRRSSNNIQYMSVTTIYKVFILIIYIYI